MSVNNKGRRPNCSLEEHALRGSMGERVNYWLSLIHMMKIRGIVEHVISALDWVNRSTYAQREVEIRSQRDLRYVWIHTEWLESAKWLDMSTPCNVTWIHSRGVYKESSFRSFHFFSHFLSFHLALSNPPSQLPTSRHPQTPATTLRITISL